MLLLLLLLEMLQLLELQLLKLLPRRCCLHGCQDLRPLLCHSGSGHGGDGHLDLVLQCRGGCGGCGGVHPKWTRVRQGLCEGRGSSVELGLGARREGIEGLAGDPGSGGRAGHHGRVVGMLLSRGGSHGVERWRRGGSEPSSCRCVGSRGGYYGGRGRWIVQRRGMVHGVPDAGRGGRRAHEHPVSSGVRGAHEGLGTGRGCGGRRRLLVGGRRRTTMLGP